MTLWFEFSYILSSSAKLLDVSPAAGSAPVIKCLHCDALDRHYLSWNYMWLLSYWNANLGGEGEKKKDTTWVADFSIFPLLKLGGWRTVSCCRYLSDLSPEEERWDLNELKTNPTFAICDHSHMMKAPFIINGSTFSLNTFDCQKWKDKKNNRSRGKNSEILRSKTESLRCRGQTRSPAWVRLMFFYVTKWWNCCISI